MARLFSSSANVSDWPFSFRHDPEVPSQLVAAAVAEFGGLDVLVANAGIASPGAICDLSIEDWDDMFSVNLRGAWLLAKASYPHLRESRGSACFTSSMSGQLPHAGSGAYSPTKAALTMLAQTLALEWAWIHTNPGRLPSRHILHPNASR